MLSLYVACIFTMVFTTILSISTGNMYHSQNIYTFTKIFPRLSSCICTFTHICIPSQRDIIKLTRSSLALFARESKFRIYIMCILAATIFFLPRKSLSQGFQVVRRAHKTHIFPQITRNQKKKNIKISYQNWAFCPIIFPRISCVASLYFIDIKQFALSQSFEKRVAESQTLALRA